MSKQEPNDFARLLGVLIGVAMVATVLAWLVLATLWTGSSWPH